MTRCMKQGQWQKQATVIPSVSDFRPYEAQWLNPHADHVFTICWLCLASNGDLGPAMAVYGIHGGLRTSRVYPPASLIS